MYEGGAGGAGKGLWRARRPFGVLSFLSGEGEVGRWVGGCGWVGGGMRGGQGQRCKIYLLPSENFDPRVVNLSKKSSQLNRKHEEEGGGGGWGGLEGRLVCWCGGGEAGAQP